MKFLADMGISLRTVVWLRSNGYDVTHLRDEGLQRLSDEEILIKARIEGRILLTVDLDFAQLLAVSGEAFPSVHINTTRLTITEVPENRFLKETGFLS
jgi:predicted nuclease of predicted toxin-antitoxin system